MMKISVLQAEYFTVKCASSLMLEQSESYKRLRILQSRNIAIVLNTITNGPSCFICECFYKEVPVSKDVDKKARSSARLINLFEYITLITKMHGDEGNLHV